MAASSSVKLGIDLGTTNSVMAYVASDGRPTVVPNGEGEHLTPSLVCFTGTEQVVGEPALELERAGVGDTAAFFKRHLSEPDWTFAGAGERYDATDLSSLVLRKLKTDAESHLGIALERAVITVPAYFKNVQREATRVAAERADLSVIRLVNEPTAAAVAFGFAHTDAHTGKRLLVYDLGGGTFDVSLVNIGAEAEEVLWSDGDHQLGGKDWDDRLVELLAQAAQEQHGIDLYAEGVAFQELALAAQGAKKRLSTLPRTTVSLMVGSRSLSIPVERSGFVEATRDLVGRTDLLVRRVLDEVGVGVSELDGIIAVGGSTRMPMVLDYLKALLGRPPMAGVNVDEAVALGAAILAARDGAQRPSRASSAATEIGTRRVIDVTNHSLGMIAVDETAGRYVNSIILPKGAELPMRQVRPYRFRTQAAEPNRMEVFVTQGEDECPAEIDYVGCYVVDKVPHEPSGWSVIDIAYAYDESGEVRVSADVRGGGTLNIRREDLPDDVPGRFLGPPVRKGGAITLMLVFDLSGSMSGTPLKEAKQAARKFLEGLDITSSAVGVAAVADKTKIVVEPVHNAKAILKAIDGLAVGDVGIGNGAHPFDVVGHSLAGANGTPVMLVLADGVWSHEDKAIAAAKACHGQGIAIVAVGFGSADEKFLAAIASSKDASFLTDLQGLAGTFQSIAQVLTEGGLVAGPGR